MEELYVEGVATHGGPESCVGVCEGVGEALTGAHAGRAIEPRNHRFGVPTLFEMAEGNIGGGVIASRRRTPRGQKNQCMYGTPCARTGRSRTPARPGDVRRAGRSGNAEAVSLR